VEEVTLKTNAGGGCQSCWIEIQEILDDIHGTSRSPAPEDEKEPFTIPQKEGLIRRLLGKEMRSMLELNGLQAELVDVKKDRATIRFKGRLVGSQDPAFLAVKRELVRGMTRVCQRPMTLLEINVIEQHASQKQKDA
jgi:hypothetical protein